MATSDLPLFPSYASRKNPGKLELPDTSEFHEPPRWRSQGYFPARYIVAVLASFGMAFNYILRVNINFTIVAMVKRRSISNESLNASVIDNCSFVDQGDLPDYNGYFDWSDFTQSLIIGSFYWGYIWTQIPGGRLAELIGPRRVFGGAILLSAILSLFIPVACKAGPVVVMVTRLLTGLCQGPVSPSTHTFLVIWAPPLERAFISSIIYGGAQAGTIIAYPLAAAIISSIGWEAVFYIHSGMAMVWAAVWFFVVSDSPEHFQRITDVEICYIKNATKICHCEMPDSVPWKSIFTSLPVWAILVASFGGNWGGYILLANIPLYLRNMMKMDLGMNAAMSGLPYFGMWFFSITLSAVGDRLLRTRVLSTQNIRKIANSIGHAGPALCLFCLSLVDCNRIGTVAMLFLSVTFLGGGYPGWVVNQIDIAPNFAGTLHGIANVVGTIPSLIAPFWVVALTAQEKTLAQWRKVFYICGALFLVDSVFFALFASGEVQPWNCKETAIQKHGNRETATKRTITPNS